MARFSLTNAEVFEEGTRRFPGLPPEATNVYSIATGSDIEHERLYRTARGRWVLRAWTVELFATAPVYKWLSTKQAAAWLVRNELAPHEACAREHAAAAKRYRPTPPPRFTSFELAVREVTQARAPKRKRVVG